MDQDEIFYTQASHESSTSSGHFVIKPIDIEKISAPGSELALSVSSEVKLDQTTDLSPDNSPIEKTILKQSDVEPQTGFFISPGSHIQEITAKLTEVEDYEKEVSLLPVSLDAISHNNKHLHTYLPITSGFNFPEDPLLDSVMDELTRITEFMITELKITIVFKSYSGTVMLSLRDLKDIIVGKSVSCSLFLGVVGGLPHCGKSLLVKNFLKHSLSISINDISSISMNEYEECGLSHYGVSILGGNADEALWWMPLTQHSMHTFTCSSAILHDSLLQGQQVELDQSATSKVVRKIFDNDCLNKHLSQVYCDIDRTLRRTDVSPELKRVLSSGVFFGNVFDAGFSKGLYEFSSLISRYAHCQLGFVVVGIDDIQHLHEPPNVKYDDEKPSMQRRSRISYLVQFAASTHLAASKPLQESPSVAFIITYNDSLTTEEKEIAKKTLDSALSHEAKRLGLPQAISKKILVLNPANQEDSKQLKYLFEDMLRKRSQRESIKLSWIFLRSLFHFTNSLYINKNELKALAAELGILNNEYEAFLQTFTEFASIFYFPDIHALKDIVILQPVKFVNLLCRLFYPPKGSDATVFDGLFSEQQIGDVLSKEESQIIESTLCSLGLAASIHSNKLQVIKRQRQPHSTDTLEDHFPVVSPRNSWLFVPSARRGELRLQQPSPESLFIIYDFKFTPPDVQGLFTQQFLSLPKVIFVPTSEVNVIKFVIPSKAGEYNIQVVFHRTALELVIDYQRPSELNSICEKVLQCCKKALDVICKMIKDLTYRFALVCLQPQKLQPGHQVETQYEFLTSKHLCYLCEASKCPLRNCWNKTVLEMHERALRQADVITADEFFNLAMNLHKHLKSRDMAEQLASSLGVNKEEEVQLAMSRYSHWQRILIILLGWQKKIGSDQATKQRLSNVLVRLRITMDVWHR